MPLSEERKGHVSWSQIAMCTRTLICFGLRSPSFFKTSHSELWTCSWIDKAIGPGNDDTKYAMLLGACVSREVERLRRETLQNDRSTSAATVSRYSGVSFIHS